MAKRRGTSSGDQWISPARGWPLRAAVRYIRLSLDFRNSAAFPYASLPPVFRRIGHLLGDHHLKVKVGRLKPNAWATDLPWRQSTYSTYCTLPLARLQDPEFWTRVLECVEPQMFISISAHRGGGATRHLAWSLERQMAAPMTDGLDLYLATRHLDDTVQARAAVRELAIEFFATLAGAAGVVGGHGEVVHLEGGYGPSASDGTDRWLIEGLIHLDYEHGLETVQGPRWITLLLPRHLERLGGKDALRRRAEHTEDLLNPGVSLKYTGWRHRRSIQIDDVGDGLLVWGCPIDEVVAASCGHTPRPALPPAMAWLIDELAKAGLLAHARTDRLDRMIEKAARDYQQYRVVPRSRPGSARQATPSLSVSAISTIVRTRRPACLRKGRVTEPPPWSKAPAETVCLRVGGDKTEGLTVYTGTADEEGGWVALAGSLKPERASLYFDSRIHGYDGQRNAGVPAWALPAGRTKQLVCPKCKGRLFHVVAALEYPDDLEPDDEPSAENLFSWFYLYAKCAYCRWSGLVGDVECA